jgi:S1/P1 Nuclease
MQAARWSDDIRTQDKAQNRPSWHYINLPFKTESQPVNILTAMAENERVVKNENDPQQKTIALAWLFHLAGDIHQPLHVVQLFTVDYPKGDRGGNEICVRVQARQPMDLHRFWDGVITSSRDVSRLRNAATEMKNRPGFERPAYGTREHQHRYVGQRELRDCDEACLPKRWAYRKSEKWEQGLYDGSSRSHTSDGVRC